MGLFDKIRKALTISSQHPHAAEFERVVKTAYKQYAAKHNYFWSPDLTETAIWTDDVKNWPDEQKISFVLYLLPVIDKCMKGKTSWSSDDVELKFNNVRLAYVQMIFRTKLVINEENALKIFQAFVEYRTSNWAGIMGWPVGLFLNQLERQYKGTVLSTAMRQLFEQLQVCIRQANTAYNEKERIKMVEKIDAVLFSGDGKISTIKPARFLGEDDFAAMANADIAQMPEQEKVNWFKLLPLAQKATGAKPSQKYLVETKAMLTEIGVEKFRKKMHEWLRFLIELKEKEQQHQHSWGNGEERSGKYLAKVPQQQLSVTLAYMYCINQKDWME